MSDSHSGAEGGGNELKADCQSQPKEEEDIEVCVYIFSNAKYNIHLILTHSVKK